MKIYWDIETEGLPQWQIEKLMPEFEAPGNIKDPAKIAAAIAEKKLDWLDKAALKGITGKIVAFSFAQGCLEPEFYSGDEDYLVKELVTRLNAHIGTGDTIYAWNGHAFDLTFLCQRAAVYGIPAFKMLTSLWRGRFSWNENLIDPKLVWSNYSPDHTGTSLKSVSLALGVGDKSGNGKDFAALLKSNPSEAESYAKNDCHLLRAIVFKMGI